MIRDWSLTKGETGGGGGSEYHKKIRLMPQYRNRKSPNTAKLQSRVEARCHAETITLLRLE